MSDAAPPYPYQNFYRVSCKALIFDDQQRLLVSQDTAGTWEIPGGGWDHEESYEDCLRRELAEELSATVATVGPLAFFFRGESEWGHPKISLVFPVTLQQGARLQPAEDELAAIRYVTKEEFKKLPFQVGEDYVQQWAHLIWSDAPKRRLKKTA